jgi:integrase
VRTDIRRGAWIDPEAGVVPLSEAAKRRQTATPHKRASSKAREASIITGHIEPALGNRPTRRITKADVKRAVNGWSDTHSASSVVRMFATLRAIMTWGCDSELIVRNPCRGIRLPQIGTVERPELDPKDLERLATELGDDATFMWCAVTLGLRWGEVAGLTVGSLDLLNGTVTGVPPAPQGR